ncbi:MAG: MmgE/PrpD family protein [Gammaproteobacteria bacterium]|nr:MmgE/PrpD family protein [Gammaproteobacteria bacterium]MBI5617051.1 MmgE/PrpD family protein [Gammaproteobacteria bacterium]
MSSTIVEQLAKFTSECDYARLPAPVVSECKRIVLDSLGCALAAVGEPKGRIGVDYGTLLGGNASEATIIGTGRRSSQFGAAFANGELINALDYDAVLPPGHVTPYVLPGALARAESRHLSGRDLITAMALAHEMSYRIGKAMDYLRDTTDGRVDPPPVYGYSSTIFGATAALARLGGYAPETTAHALGIAGCIAPVQSQVAWFQHAPSSTIKYLLAGALVQAAQTAAHMAELGHRGDLQVLDDREYGFPRFIGTRRWMPDRITSALGTEWLFTAEQAYKPYPHCRILHALLDAERAILDEHGIAPEEIDGIKAWVEGFVEQPVWQNRRIEQPHDAQFSIAHGLAFGAMRVPPGKAWQEPARLNDPVVMKLMDRTSYEVHPDYVEMLLTHGASRPARIEITARGRTFVGERRYPKGSPSPEAGTAMTDEELIAKFRHNAEGAVAPAQIDEVVARVFALETVSDVGAVMQLVAGGVPPAAEAGKAHRAA